MWGGQAREPDVADDEALALRWALRAPGQSPRRGPQILRRPLQPPSRLHVSHEEFRRECPSCEVFCSHEDPDFLSGRYEEVLGQLRDRTENATIFNGL